METWVYLDNNDALPRIFKNAHPSFIAQYVLILDDSTDECLNQFRENQIHHITVKVNDVN